MMHLIIIKENRDPSEKILETVRINVNIKKKKIDFDLSKCISQVRRWISAIKRG